MLMIKRQSNPYESYLLDDPDADAAAPRVQVYFDERSADTKLLVVDDEYKSPDETHTRYIVDNGQIILLPVDAKVVVQYDGELCILEPAADS